MARLGKLGLFQLLTFGLVLLSLSAEASVAGAKPSPTRGGGDDVTVIAVIDSGISPHHWDYLASKMPQALDGNRRNDLPLDRPPHEWLQGFPDPKTFARYAPIPLTLEETDPGAPVEALRHHDQGVLGSVAPSGADKVRYHWMPGTKVIGALDFDGGGIDAPTTAHGTGASSVAVGNLHGTCPSCVLVFLDTSFDYEASNEAIRWAASQPWIDAISNSYGKNMVISNDYARDGIYLGETAFQRRASERGQTIFFAAHNGVERSFIAPTSPLLSSEAGPDWVVTVGAVSAQDRASYTGHGKPADIASLGSAYPSASGSETVGGSGTFSGTSNATPVIAGMYGQALYEVRTTLGGPSRTQARGVIAVGRGVGCGSKRRHCELSDSRLTAEELRTRLFHGAQHTEAGMTVGGIPPASPPVGEDEFLNEGHGTYHGLMDGPSSWRTELNRIVEPLLGEAKTLRRPDGELEWMVADSFCRQHFWGSWDGGYYREGAELPAPALEWPLRTALISGCLVAETP